MAAIFCIALLSREIVFILIGEIREELQGRNMYYTLDRFG